MWVWHGFRSAIRLWPICLLLSCFAHESARGEPGFYWLPPCSHPPLSAEHPGDRSRPRFLSVAMTNIRVRFSGQMYIVGDHCDARPVCLPALVGGSREVSSQLAFLLPARLPASPCCPVPRHWRSDSGGMCNSVEVSDTTTRLEIFEGFADRRTQHRTPQAAA